MSKTKTQMNSQDPVIIGSLPALRRAARAAWKLAKETNTPFYVLQGGRVVDLNPTRRKPKPVRRRLLD